MPNTQFEHLTSASRPGERRRDYDRLTVELGQALQTVTASGRRNGAPGKVPGAAEPDAVIFVTSFDAPLSRDELEFLPRVREHGQKILFVVSKADPKIRDTSTNATSPSACSSRLPPNTPQCTIRVTRANASVPILGRESS